MPLRSETRPKRPASGAWNVDTLDGGVTRLTFGDRLWVLLTSDWHWDSVKCDRDRLKADLELAMGRMSFPLAAASTPERRAT